MPSSRVATRQYTCRVRILRGSSISATGVRGEPQPIAEDVFVTPIDPVSAETAQRLVLETPVNMFETFAPYGTDVQFGDIIYVYDTEEQFTVKNVGVWKASHSEMVLEKVRTYA